MDSPDPKHLKCLRFEIGADDPMLLSNSNESIQTDNMLSENSLAPLLSSPTRAVPLEMSASTGCLRYDNSSTSSSSVSKQNVVDLFYVSHPSPNKDQWVEKCRFIRYEEDREGYDNHFGKPHVPCIPMEYYRQLLQIANKAIVLTDVVYTDFDSFCDFLQVQLVDQEVPNIGTMISKLLISRRVDCSAQSLGLRRLSSTQSLNKQNSDPDYRLRQLMSVPNNLGSMAQQTSTRKLTTALSTLKFLSNPTGREGVLNNMDKEEVLIIAGSVPDMGRCRLVMIRFTDAVEIQELTANKNVVRCLYFLTGPTVENLNYLDIGRALGSVLSNPEFTGRFNTLETADNITQAIDNFLSESIILAPGRIDSKYLVAGDLIRKVVNKRADKHEKTHLEAEKHRQEMGGNVMKMDVEKQKHPAGDEEPEKWKLFSGMVEDIRKRSEFYMSDWYDGLNFPAFMSTFFMFCACIAPSLTFGGLMQVYTGGEMGVFETLMAQGISGILWSVFAAQPLIIVSPTGPFLIFEHALYQICSSLNLPFMVVRFWAGLAIFMYSLLVTAFGGARLLKYLTIFTEDIFSTLISMIFLNEVIKYVEKEWESNPVQEYEFYEKQHIACSENKTMGIDCSPLSIPNSFLLNFNIVICTFAISFLFRYVSRSRWFGRNFRSVCGDFGIFFAIMIISAMRYCFFDNVKIKALELPTGFKLSGGRDSILVKPYIDNWLIVPIAAGAGALVFILLFVETEITEQMLLRKDRKLKKGGGLHWDLVLMGFIVFINSVLGLPWMCAAAVQSLAHCSSLTVLKKKAPGEPAKPVSVIEQRSNTLILSLEMGLFAFIGRYVHIPSACFFGVFLYLGIVNLAGNQFIKRFCMFFLPSKYRGPKKYLEVIPFRRIIGYTLIQAALVVIIFLAKLNEHLALFFPLILASFIIGRQVILPLIFSASELEMLDGEHDGEEEPNVDDLAIDCYYNTRIPV